MNPEYGMPEWDIQIQVAISKFLRKMNRKGEMGVLIADVTGTQNGFLRMLLMRFRRNGRTKPRMSILPFYLEFGLFLY